MVGIGEGRVLAGMGPRLGQAENQCPLQAPHTVCRNQEEPETVGEGRTRRHGEWNGWVGLFGRPVGGGRGIFRGNVTPAWGNNQQNQLRNQQNLGQLGRGRSRQARGNAWGSIEAQGTGTGKAKRRHTEFLRARGRVKPKVRGSLWEVLCITKPRKVTITQPGNKASAKVSTEFYASYAMEAYEGEDMKMLKREIKEILKNDIEGMPNACI